MLKRIDGGVYLSKDGKIIPKKEGAALYGDSTDAREKTISYGIMRKHCQSQSKDKMNIKFDALISHDITYVGIIQKICLPIKCGCHIITFVINSV